VWPSWFLKIFTVADGPYETWIDRTPVLKTDGKVRRHGSIPRVKLPMCQPCNGELDRRFEKPAKAIGRRVVASDALITLDVSEAMQCALWFLETWLFLASPAAINTNPVAPARGWAGMSEDLWS
jgi:hypothetical protein